MQYFVVIDPKDNVATAVRDVEAGETIQTNLRHTVTLLERIEKGHKVAIAPIKVKEPVVKYGETICLAKVDIQIGQHVHVHNIIDILTEKVEAWRANEV